MSAAVKYLFEQAFETRRDAAAGKLMLDNFEDDRRFRAADIKAAREAGFAEGRLAGLAEAQAGIEAASAAALELLANRMGELFADRDTAIEQVRQEAARTAVATARALAGALLRRLPGTEVEALLAEALPELHDQTRVTVRLSPEALATLAPRLERIADAAGFGGRIDLAADAARGDQDCVVEWSGGGVERDEARLTAAIEAALARFAPAETGDEPDPEATAETYSETEDN